MISTDTKGNILILAFVLMLASSLFLGEISVVMLAFVLASLEKTRLNPFNKK